MDPLQQIIDSITPSDLLIDEPTFFIFKNDVGYDKNFPHFHTQNFDNLSVGILIGPGSLISLLPDVPCESIIVLDINKFVISNAQHTLSVFEKSSDIIEYLKNLYSNENPFHQQLLPLQGQSGLMSLRDAQIFSLGKFHHEYCHLRFNQCKSALTHKSIYFLHMNINDIQSLKLLSQKLSANNFSITFADYSNVHEYSRSFQNLEEGLGSLPYSHPTTIVYSAIIKTSTHIGSQPISHNFTDYFNSVKQIFS